jgi:FkbM family methyltransferase
MIDTTPFYRLLEWLTRGRGLYRRVSGTRIKLPARYIRYFPARYEAVNFSLLKKHVRDDSVVLDIGAHIGLFSVIAAKWSGTAARIYAFEPAPSSYRVLERTIQMNRLAGKVVPVQAAVGSESGTIDFFVSDQEADNSNSLVPYKSDRPLRPVSVPLESIDHFVAERQLTKVDFIKIDVEGAEYDTLRGGLEVLRRFRPVVILAIHPEPILNRGDSLEAIYSLLEQLPYQVLLDGKPVTKELVCANRALVDLHLLPR